MLAICFLAIAGTLSSCTRQDAIDKIVRKASSDPFFGSGPCKLFQLPVNSTSEELVKKAFANAFPFPIHAYNFVIITKRKVIISRLPYTAIEVQTENGKYVVLLLHADTGQEWWSKVFSE